MLPLPRPAALWAKLALIEARTIAALRPLATAMGPPPVDKAAVRREGRDEAADWQALPFAEGMAIGVRDYPTGYEQEFRVVRPIALPQAKCAVQLLIDHEVAITDMARAELARAFGPAAPLDTYLAQVAGGTAGGAHDR